MHFEAGGAIGTFPSILGGCFFEPTDTCLLGYRANCFLNPISPEHRFGHEFLWKQQISQDSEYRLKYAIDQGHRLGAKYKTKYSEDSSLSISGSMATTAYGGEFHHTQKLTDKLSTKVLLLIFNVDWN